jgi:hypothetical protein
MFSTLPEAIEQMVMAKSQLKMLIEKYNYQLCMDIINTPCEIKKNFARAQLSENITVLNKINHCEYKLDELIQSRKNISDKYNKYINKLNHSKSISQ